MKYIHRSVEQVFLKLNQSAKIMLVTGSRQVGKTTLLKHLAKEVAEEFNYVTMDDLVARDLAKNDPALFLQQYQAPLIIDEVQYAPELFPELKRIVDENESTGRYWLTGSQQFAMMKKVSESLVGRVRIIELSGLSYCEMMGAPEKNTYSFTLDALMERQSALPETNINDVFQRIWLGGMPALQEYGQDDLIEINNFFSTYVNTYLMRDVMELGGIRNILEFRKFLSACGLLVGQQLNYKTLADHVGVSQKTAKEWVSLLVGMNILYLLEPYYNNRLSRLAKTPKLYFKDTGLAAWLIDQPDPQTLMNSPYSGNFFENYIVMELNKNLTNQQKRMNLSYYRDSNGREIDVVLQMDGKLHPLEIKKSASPKRKEVTKFQLLSADTQPIGTGGIVCMVPKVVAIDEQNCFIPANLI